MDWEKKQAKRRFCFLAIGLITYHFLFGFIVFGIDFIEIETLLFIFYDMQWQQAAEIVYHSGIGLSIASIIGTIVMALIVREVPSFEKKEVISLKTMALFYILMQAIQLLGNYILLPIMFFASSHGYHLEEAIEAASSSSVLFSSFCYSVIIAPVAEEILCRGIIMKNIEKYGKAFAVLISSMLFGLLHQNIVQFPVTMMIGVLFGYLAQRYSLKAAIGLHILNNVSVELIGILGKRYSVVWILDGIFLYICAFFSVVILWKKRKTIKQFFRDDANIDCEKKPVIKWFFTTPFMLMVLFYFLFFTLKSMVSF